MSATKKNIATNNSSENRAENKVPLDECQYRELDSILLQLGILPRKVHEDRIVNSIYYYDVECSDYFENVSGISQRKKVRIRWYNDDVQNLRLEIKKKSNKLSEKLVYPFKAKFSNFPESVPELDEVVGKVSGDAPIFLKKRFPMLAVKYHRSYFELEPGLRMTVDKNIMYRALYPNYQPFWFDSPVHAVVEFKYSISAKKTLNKIINSFPYRLFRHSKYVIGMDVVQNA